MKRNVIIAFAGFFLCSLSVRAQLVELEWIYPDVGGRNALLTPYAGAQRVTYCEDTTETTGYFIGRTQTTPPVEKKMTLPGGMRVTAMEQYADHLLFCGNNMLSHDYVGIMNVQGSLAGSLPICWANIPSVSYYVTGERIGRFEATRMTFFTDSSTTGGYSYHVLLVVRCIVTSVDGEEIGPNPQSRTTLCEGVYDANGWKFYVYYNPKREIEFTDVAATDNYIVAVGTDSETGWMFIKLFERHHDAAIAHPVIQHQLTELMRESVSGTVLVEAMRGDRFATASYYSDGQQAGSTVKVFDINSVSNLIPVCGSHLVQGSTPYISTRWRLRSMCYDRFYNRLCLLQDMDYPISTTTVSAVQEYDVSNFDSATALTTWNAGIEMNDVTYWNGFGWQAAGTEGSVLMKYSKMMGHSADSCWQSTTCQYEDSPFAPVGVLYLEDYISDEKQIKNEVALPAVTISLEVGCNDYLR